MSKRYSLDMTNGPFLKKIMIFAVPLMLTGILQLAYNTADVVVVGKFVGPQALAAVGSVLYFSNFSVIVPTSGALPGLRAFVAAVFGGIGSVPGAVVGAFIIGICESIIRGTDFATFSDAFTFALLIIILVVKPTGLFGEKVTDKV